MIAAERLLQVFVEAADTLVADYDVVEFMQRLTENVAEITGGDAVGLLLSDKMGQLQFMAATSQQSRDLELFQLQNGEGPCLDCFHAGAPVIMNDLSEAGARWLSFAPKAIKVGFRSVHAFPMRLRERVIGVLTVLSRAPLPPAQSQEKTIQALADVATIAILHQQSLTAAEVLTEQLQGALNSRIVIEQAKGVVARNSRIDVDQAFSLIRRYARNHGARLNDVAHSLANRELDPDALNSSTHNDS